jgi:hypothetical protein
MSRQKTKLMKTLKLSLTGALLCSLVFFACNKNENEQVVEIQETETVKSIFTPTEDANAVQEKAELSLILEGLIETVEVITPRAAMVTECCLNNVLEKVTHPTFGWINLHLEYDVSDPAQVVQIKHWEKVGGSWTYLGQDNITTSYDDCTEKSVNMSVGHLPSSEILSWSRIWDASTGSFCGGSKIAIWDNF